LFCHIWYSTQSQPERSKKHKQKITCQSKIMITVFWGCGKVLPNVSKTITAWFLFQQCQYLQELHYLKLWGFSLDLDLRHWSCLNIICGIYCSGASFYSTNLFKLKTLWLKQINRNYTSVKRDSIVICLGLQLEKIWFYQAQEKVSFGKSINAQWAFDRYLSTFRYWA